MRCRRADRRFGRGLRRVARHAVIVVVTQRRARSARLLGMSLHEWTVAGGLIETDAGVLLVRNLRRGGFEDWSTPGGVIDADDADIVAGLTREVLEETGLTVREWVGPLYEVRAYAPDMGWRMRCEVYLAVAVEGELHVDDPDGIVVEARYVPHVECDAHLESGAPWVREPLAAWLQERWEPSALRAFDYEVSGTTRESMRVVRGAAS
jgi:ADP-ribose pyrophosphatase YjhB (NUDIX family)